MTTEEIQNWLIAHILIAKCKDISLDLRNRSDLRLAASKMIDHLKENFQKE